MKTPKWSKIAIYLILILKTVEICGEGCAKCEETNLCGLCHDGYYTDSTKTCIKQEIDGCRLYRVNQGCFGCLEGYYYEDINKNCVSLTESERQPNCLYHADLLVCQECLTNYIVQSGACILVDNLVDNCKKYNENEKCSVCKSGFLLSLIGTCIEVTSKPNCISYSNKKCIGCKANYKMEKNLLEKNWRFLLEMGVLLSRRKSMIISYLTMRLLKSRSLVLLQPFLIV